MSFLQDLWTHTFLQFALLAGVLAGVSTGIVGSYVVTRRITYLAGAIAHFVLGGMGMARYFSITWNLPWLTPIHGALAAALLAACIIAIIRLRGRQREDSVVGALWAMGMAVGILFISRTPGFNEDLMSYLFGNILLVGESQLWWLLGLDLAVVALAVIFHNAFQAVCFDEDFATLRGVRPAVFYTLLLLLVSLTVVVLIMVVGIILVIALMTLPAAIASQYTRRLWQMMALSILLSIGFSTLGLWLSYEPDLPVGATIIVLAGATYIASLTAGRWFQRRGRFGQEKPRGSR